MKTATIELPNAVFDKLADEAARRRQSVPGYMAELLASHTADSAGPRIEPELPLIRSSRPGSVVLTNHQIAEAEAAEDAQRYGRLTGR